MRDQARYPDLAAASSQQGLALAVKRTIDVLAAGSTLLLLALLFTCLAIAVWIDSGRPIFYRSRRHGRNGRSFSMYKFRTMVPDAEQRLHELRHLNLAQGNQVKIPNDPRRTRLGRLLRRTSLDELPNLINVIKGEMSLIGPRPHSLME